VTPTPVRTVVESLADPAPDVREAVFRLVDPPALSFAPGQYVTVRVPDSAGDPQTRAFSIASEPADGGRLVLVAKLLPGGLSSAFFRSLRPGADVLFEAPFGKFALCPERGRPALFVATGTGIAPFRSMIRHLLLTERTTRPMTLLFGVRREEDLFWTEDFEKLARSHPNFRVVSTLSQPSSTWRGRHGRVTAWVAEEISDASPLDVYLCGGRPMIEEVRRRLLERGADPAHVHREEFY
jgi:NAD(P)H-flavin reductase